MNKHHDDERAKQERGDLIAAWHIQEEFEKEDKARSEREGWDLAMALELSQQDASTLISNPITSAPMYQDASASLREGYKARGRGQFGSLVPRYYSGRYFACTGGHGLHLLGLHCAVQNTLFSTERKDAGSTHRTWVDEVVGLVETDDIYDFKNVVGYDIDECTRDWLRNNRSEGYESYEGLSICEVMLIDPRFSCLTLSYFGWRFVMTLIV